MGDDSGTGVAFTRDPSTGENKLLRRVSDERPGRGRGGRHPHAPADRPARRGRPRRLQAARRHPQEARDHYRDMQDIEFTIEKGKLYMLQTRSGKRTARRVKVAVDMAEEGLITKEEAVGRVPAERSTSSSPGLRPDEAIEAEKQAASSPRACRPAPAPPPGRSSFTPRRPRSGPGRARRSSSSASRPAPRTSAAWRVAKGILTTRGGMTSHAAVVARGMGKCCVAGCGDLRINYNAKTLTAGGKTLSEGDWISLERLDRHASTWARSRSSPPRSSRSRTASSTPARAPLRQYNDHEAGGQVPHAGRPHQRRHAARHRGGRQDSAPRASACTAPSTCSSRATASSPCGR